MKTTLFLLLAIWGALLFALTLSLTDYRLYGVPIAVVFCAAHARAYPLRGVWSLIGCMCNLTAISANGWRMPVLFAASGKVYNERTHFLFLNPADVRMYPLCDIFPGGFSVGDIFLWFGLIVTLLALMADHRKLGAIREVPA